MLHTQPRNKPELCAIEAVKKTQRADVKGALLRYPLHQERLLVPGGNGRQDPKIIRWVRVLETVVGLINNRGLIRVELICGRDYRQLVDMDIRGESTLRI